ncbi:ribonuclease G [Shouchella lonarensis]|uniref:Ribonuclease G n=2 Tax=Shouchella lonarensis TaxID=1464122 RepID=A0A1G6GI06_9BACI|nr:ribonuclease G [Shouchella lonarensis]
MCMEKKIVVTKGRNGREAVVLEEGEVVEWFIEQAHAPELVGSVFIGKVQRVLPGMQAAFVDIGIGKNGFLYRDELLRFHLDPDPVEVKQQRKITHYVQQHEMVLVQVTKASNGEKGPRLSGVIAIPGRYLVYMPEANYVAVSRRIKDESVREHLSEKMTNELQQPEGLIVRTAAAACEPDMLAQELHVLRTLWSQTVKPVNGKGKPALVYQAASIIETLVTNYVEETIDEVVLDDLSDYRLVQKLLGTAPLIQKVRLYRTQGSTFALNDIDRQLEKARRRRIWLKNGAFIVIDETEAMVVIDVNTGKFTGSNGLEQTVLAVNCLAAKEVAKQIRLRNLSGMIAIDFIDMKTDEEREKVQQTLLSYLKKDRVQTSVKGFTPVGVLFMTRKKTRLPMRVSVSMDCPSCAGTGVVLTVEAQASQFERMLLMYMNQEVEALVIAATSEAAMVLLGASESDKTVLEQRIGAHIFVVYDDALPVAACYTLVYAGSFIEAEKQWASRQITD